jgi:hypothetical protein
LFAAYGGVRRCSGALRLATAGSGSERANLLLPFKGTTENKKKPVKGITKVFEDMGISKVGEHIVIYEAPKSNWTTGRSCIQKNTPKPLNITLISVLLTKFIEKTDLGSFWYFFDVFIIEKEVV